MKKITSLLIVFLLTTTLLACGGSHALTGKYRCDTEYYGDYEIMDFKNDGTFLSYFENDALTADGTYEYTDGSYQITVAGLGMKLTETMEVSGDILTVQYGDDDPLTFTKVK